MKSFHLGQRVKITNEEHPLNGKTGAVARCRISDDGAWVQMSEPIPSSLAMFPEDDNRRDHIILYPDECEVASSVPEASKSSTSHSINKNKIL